MRVQVKRFFQLPRCLLWWPRFRLRRLTGFIVFGVLALSSIRFYLGVQELLAGCPDPRSDVWNCRRQKAKHNGDARPLVGDNEAREPWFRGFGSALDDIYGAVSDTIRNHGSLSSWDYARDAGNTSMSRRRCQAVFPGFYGEIDRSRLQFAYGKITEADIDDIDMSDGRVRVRIVHGKLYVLSANISDETRPHALAVLQSLDDVVSHPGPSFVPDIEFVFSVRRPKSVKRQRSQRSSPVWVFERREGEDEKVWLMPSPGHVFGQSLVSTPVKPGDEVKVGGSGSTVSTDSLSNRDPNDLRSHVGTMHEMVERDRLVTAIEFLEATIPFQHKSKRLVGVWTTDDVPATVRQKALAWAATDRSWVQYENKTTSGPTLGGIDRLDERVVSQTGNNSAWKLSQMCRFQFLAHDTSFHIPITDGPLLCTSVLLTTKPEWIGIYHRLILADSSHFHMGDAEHPVVKGWGGSNGAGTQNAVLVADDWSDLQYKVDGLLRYPEVAEAIAKNNADTFRRRYLTSAATACYWREMFRAYSSASFTPSGAVLIEQSWGRNSTLGRAIADRKEVRWDDFAHFDERVQASFNI